jgi:hypothetical protein
MTKYRLTCRGKTDGFGCQLNAKLSGIAFCETNHQWRWVHSPFTNVSHGYRGRHGADKINKFMGPPLRRWKGTPNRILKSGCQKVYNNPLLYYNSKSLSAIREWFWANKNTTDCDIAIHIRRGDVSRNRTGDRRRRFVSNRWYSENIPNLIKDYPESYSVNIYSEGNFEDFKSILNGWSKDLKDRVVWKLGKRGVISCENNMLDTFHDMCSAKVLIQSWSGLSYCAGIINENIVVFRKGSLVTSQNKPLRHWNVF